MRNFFFVMLCFLTLNMNAQEDENVKWLNNNLIAIEDANPDSELEIFHKNIPDKFKNANIFGFGEATHNGKEFFDIKAKFFKYLVEHQDVKVFIMEESYPAEAGINEWISGGKGDIKTIANNFSIMPWRNKEVVNLFEWMRNFNSGKAIEDQIRFYGMDIQFMGTINQEIRDFVKEHKIPVNEELLSVVDSCSDKKIDYKNRTDWADIQIPKLEKIEQIIADFQKNSNAKENEEFISVLRALNYLKKYTYYLQHSRSEVRDLKMFENVKWIVSNKAKNGKAFIWAHNEHINNIEISPSGSGWISVGGHLKEYYKDNYYSVYFDFGKGALRGYVIKKNKPNYWDVFEIEEPFRKTYAKTLIKADKDIYFIDMDSAMNSPVKGFFKDEKRQLLLGGSGYSPGKIHRAMVSLKYSEICDGLIFVKNISVPNYDLNSN